MLRKPIDDAIETLCMDHLLNRSRSLGWTDGEALQVFCGGKSAAEHLERFAEGSSWEARRG
jgi:hypothetical protein